MFYLKMFKFWLCLTINTYKNIEEIYCYSFYDINISSIYNGGSFLDYDSLPFTVCYAEPKGNIPYTSDCVIYKDGGYYS